MNKDHRDSHLIFFGEKEESILLSDIKESRFSLDLQNLVQDHGLQKFVVLNQVHGSAGVMIDDLKSASWFVHQADFLITNQKNIALIVLTADCVPLVLYDPIVQAIGLVHAGWKGSYAGVLHEALQTMQQKYLTNFSNLVCTFGPSAASCCYEVSERFMHDFATKYSDFIKIEQRNQKYYFDNSLFLQQLLKKFGIPLENIYTDSALCSMCNPWFCSFRKEKEMANRQITMVALL